MDRYGKVRPFKVGSNTRITHFNVYYAATGAQVKVGHTVLPNPESFLHGGEYHLQGLKINETQIRADSPYPNGAHYPLHTQHPQGASV